MKIYVASSWRNTRYEEVCKQLTEAGHIILDWRKNGFRWSDVLDKPTDQWTLEDKMKVFSSDLPLLAFHNDYMLMREAHVGVLLLPCGKSAHLEIGHMSATKPTFVLEEVADTPELMYYLCTRSCISITELLIGIDRLHL